MNDNSFLSILSNSLSTTKDDIVSYVRENIEVICQEKLIQFKEDLNQVVTSSRMQELEKENTRLRKILNMKDYSNPSVNTDDCEDIPEDMSSVNLLFDADVDKSEDDKISSNVKRIKLEIVDPCCTSTSNSNKNVDIIYDCEYCGTQLNQEHIKLYKDNSTLHYCADCYSANKIDLKNSGWAEIDNAVESTYTCQLCDKVESMELFKYELKREFNNIVDYFVLCSICFKENKET